MWDLVQVITLKPVSLELPVVIIAFSSTTCTNAKGNRSASTKSSPINARIARTAVKALNTMQHVYRLPKVMAQVQDNRVELAVLR
jgi:hypothetical protein